jgi:histidine ammonia-lyase
VSEVQIVLDGASLSCQMVVSAARDRAKLALAPGVRDRVRAAQQVANRAAQALADRPPA